MIFVKSKGSWKEPLIHPSRQRSPLTIHRYLRSKPTNPPSLYDFICITDIIVNPFLLILLFHTAMPLHSHQFLLYPLQ